MYRLVESMPGLCLYNCIIYVSCMYVCMYVCMYHHTLSDPGSQHTLASVDVDIHVLIKSAP